MFSRDNIWTKAAKLGQEEWYEMYVRPFHCEVALVGMGVLAQVISQHPVKVIGLPTGTFTSKCAKGLHLLRLRSQCIFIPIERQWQQRLMTTH